MARSAIILTIDLASPVRRVLLSTTEDRFWVEEMVLRSDAAAVLPTSISHILTQAGCDKKDLTHIVGNIGPGGLSATRAGIAFANAYAFGLRLPTACITYLDLLGREARHQGYETSLCIKRAANETAFVGLYDQDRIVSQHYGHFPEALAKSLQSCRTIPSVAVGDLAPGTSTFLPGEIAIHHEITAPSSEILLKASRDAIQQTGPLIPINELSPDFKGGNGS